MKIVRVLAAGSWSAAFSWEAQSPYGLLRLPRKSECHRFYLPSVRNNLHRRCYSTEGQKKWRPLRKGNADLHRRAEVSQAANARFMDALASVDDSTSIQELLAPLQKPITSNGRRVRALRPMAGDRALLEAINHGEFAINGFRNRDLQRLLFSTSARSHKEKQRRSAAISRKLRMLREHGLIRKVARTHRYQLTEQAPGIIAAVLTANRASVAQLNRLKEAA